MEKSNEAVKLSNQVIHQIEREIEESAARSDSILIKKTQRAGSDIFGFGEIFRGKHPAYWKREVRTKENWQQIYKDLSVEVRVEAHIRRIGMKAK